MHGACGRTRGKRHNLSRPWNPFLLPPRAIRHSRHLRQAVANAAAVAAKLAAEVEDLHARGLERQASERLREAKTAALAGLRGLLVDHPQMFGHDPARGLPSVLHEQVASFLPQLARLAPGATVALFSWLTVNQVGLQRGRRRRRAPPRDHGASEVFAAEQAAAVWPSPGFPFFSSPILLAVWLFLSPPREGHAAEQQGRAQRLRHRRPRHLRRLRGAL